MSSTTDGIARLVDPIRRAVEALCDEDPDWAAQRNTRGFSAADAPFGHALAALPDQRWTPEVLRDAWELLQRYRRQLYDLGVDVAALPEPPDYDAKVVSRQGPRGPWRTTRGRDAVVGYGRAHRRGAVAMAFLDGDCVMVDSAFDRQVIDAVRAVPGRKWLGAPPLWKVPLTVPGAADRVLAMVDDLGLVVPEGFTEAVRAQAAHSAACAQVVPAVEGGVAVRLPYGHPALDAIRSVPGAGWSPTAECWVVPFDEIAWAELEEHVAAHGLTVDPGLEAAAANLMAARRAARAASAATAPRQAELVVPGMRPEARRRLDGAQVAGIEYLVDHAAGAINADEQGVGKTVVSLCALAVLGRQRTVVVCPAIAKAKWAQEAEAWFEDLPTAVVDSRRAEASQAAVASHRPGGRSVVIVNYEILAAHLETLAAWAPDALVLDEAHRIKSASSASGKAALGLAEAVQRAGGSVLCLSGTPMPNRPAELISLLRATGRLDQLGGWLHFVRYYCAGRRVQVRGRQVWDLSGKAHLDQLNRRLRETCMLRRRLRDICPDLVLAPPEIMPVTADPAVMAEYRRAEADIVRYLSEQAARLAAELGKDPRSAAVLARLRTQMAKDAVELAVLRRLVGTAKVQAAVSVAADLLEGGEGMAALDDDPAEAAQKLVVFAWHHDVVDALVRELDALHIRGEDPRHVRERARQRFQDDPGARVIVCSLGAASEAIELTAASTCLTVEWDWVPKTHAQAVSRLHRRGQRHLVRQLYLTVPGTIDEPMQGVLDTKRDAAAVAIDGEQAKTSARTVELDVMASLVRRS
ncbi:MAG TPA: DEAD/DEAH box helicase [Acidimicrobiales bacterium]|nr:DEAD/DEAH box helicase [Acidimicrobiales bacterium]